MLDKWSTLPPGEHIAISEQLMIVVLRALTRFAFGDYFKDDAAMLEFKRDYEVVSDIKDCYRDITAERPRYNS